MQMKSIFFSMEQKLSAWGISKHTMKHSLSRIVSRIDQSIWTILMLGFVCGFLIVGDFGVSWDEYSHQVYAEQTLLSYSGALDTHETIANLRFYGPFYSLLAEGSGRVLQFLHPEWGLAEGRHFAYYLTFLAGVYFFYRIARRYAGKFAASASTLMLASQPLLFGHAFINPKDLPFMVFFMIVLETGWLFADAAWPQEDHSAGKSTNTGEGERDSFWRSFYDVLNGADRSLKILLASLLSLSALLALDFFVTGFSVRLMKNFLSDSYNNTGWRPLVLLFNSIATDAWKTPLEQYYAKIDGVFSWGRYFLIGGFFLGIASYSLKRFKLKFPRPWSLLLLGGVFLGWTISIRILGGLAALIVCLILILRGKRRSLVPITVYGITAALTAYASWPFLWGNPLKNFLAAFETMRKFPYTRTVIYLGEYVHSYELPRLYVPKMLALQITIPALLLALTGLMIIIVSRKLRVPATRFVVLFLWLGIPMVWTILGERIFYDNGRQLIFALPPLFLFASISIDWLWNSLDRKWVVLIVVISLLPSLYAIFRLHPYQYVYYNALIGGLPGAEGQYELDYWCTSGKEAIVHINESAAQGAQVDFNCEGAQVGEFARPDLELRPADRSPDLDYLIFAGRLSSPDEPPEGMILDLGIDRAGVRLGEVWVRP
jgi:hypothetical protein